MAANPQDESVEGAYPPSVDLDRVMSNIGIGSFHYQTLLMCGLGFSAVSIEVVLMAFLLPELRLHWNLDEYKIGLLATSGMASSILGQLGWGALADRFGRRIIFMTTVLFVALFGALTSLAQTPLALICLRSGASFGLGGNISVDFSLFTELLPTERRGNMLLMMQAFWPLGQLATCLVAWSVIPTYGWRAFLVACMVPSLLTAFLRPLIPESPRWLLLHGYVEQATEVCRHIAVKNGKQPEDVGLAPGVTLCLGANSATPLCTTSSDAEKKGGPAQQALVGKLFSQHLRWTTFGIITFGAALHSVGYGNMTFMPSMLDYKGVPKQDKYLLMVLATLAEIPGVFAVLLSSSYLGRLLPMKAALLFVSMSFMCFALAQRTMSVSISMCTSAFFVEACWACFHVYTPEVYPTELRATATGFIHSTGALISALVPMSTAFLLETYGLSHVCTYFVMCGMLGSLGAYLFLHIETHDRDLDDVVFVKSTRGAC